MQKLSVNQKEALISLTTPYRNGGNHHPIDAFKGQTIHSLQKRGLVSFYEHHLFLHGAVRLTANGKEVAKLLMV